MPSRRSRGEGEGHISDRTGSDPMERDTVFSDRHASRLGDLLIPASHYHPFPTAAERQPWGGLSDTLRRHLIASAEQLLNHAWPALPATLYMDFARTGERKNYEGPYFSRRGALASLVLAECAEGKARFLDDVANGIWAICEETSWVIPAHNPGFAGDRSLPDFADHSIELFSAETGTLLAWTQYLLRPQLDAISPTVSARLRREVKLRILDPFFARGDFWWMGGGPGRLNNWSPWCCSTCLAAFLLLEEDAARRAAAAAKVMQILDRWLAWYHPDGGCDEGPSYWTVAGGALFDCLELLSWATDAKINVYDQPLIQEIGRYIYRVHISGDYYVNFADCPAKVHLPAGLVYRYGRRIGDEHMAALGAHCHQGHGGHHPSRSLLRALPDLFHTEGIEAPAQPPFVRDVWLPGTQIMVAREREGSDRGFYLAAKGGHNDESHNHNDVGHFIVYYDGQPVLIDVGVGTYTRQTFSDQRYDIWTMQSAYHNLPTVNGVQQQAGEQFRATDLSCRRDDSAAELTLDIAKAYPPEAGVKSWRRTCRLVRGERTGVVIVDDFTLARPTRDIALSLLTPCEPSVKMAGELALSLPASGLALRLAYDAAVLEAVVETIPLDDPSLQRAWGDRLYRIVLKAKTATAAGKWAIRLAVL
jgi:hypothetical protein